MTGKRNSIFIGLLLCCTLPLFFSSCVNDNLLDLTKTEDSVSVVCDTAFEISYKYDIAPIITANCATTCHNETYYMFNGGDIRLDTWSFLKQKVDEGLLLCAINQTKENGCQPMPRVTASNETPGPKIDNCYIMRIDAWIRQGAKNN